MSKNSIKAALIQHHCSDDLITNQQPIIAGIQHAKANGCNLVLLQEMHNHRYFCQQQQTAHFDLAEPVPGPGSQFLAQQAADNQLVIVGSVFEKRMAGVYHNSAIVLDADGTLAGLYRKMHIPEDPGYHEKFYFSPGDSGFKPIKTSIGKLGVLICWDQWFPEAARLMTLAGADMLLYPTAIGWDPNDTADQKQQQLEAWKIIQRSHAIANGIPLLCCNRVGFEASENSTGIEFWGNSFVLDCFGKIIAQAPAAEENILLAEFDLADSEKIRTAWPFLRDRRIDAYRGLSN